MIVIAVYNTDSASWWYLVYITFLMIASCEFVVISSTQTLENKRI